MTVKEPVAGPSACQQLRQLLKEALQTLQDEGVVYRKVISQDEVYHVSKNRDIFSELQSGLIMDTCLFDVVVFHQATAHDTDLFIAVKDIIREDSKRERCK